MTRSILTLAGFCLIAAGDGEAAQAKKAQGAKPKTAATALAKGNVSGFTAPTLAGLVVRDHPQGAIVVAGPRACADEPPGGAGAPKSATCFTYKPCMVLTNVNGTQVRNAAHFRDLMNAPKQNDEQDFVAWTRTECP